MDWRRKTKNVESMIDAAIDVARRSTLYRFKTGAIINVPHYGIYEGCSHVSHYRMSDPGYEFSIHAELDALMGACKPHMAVGTAYVATLNKKQRYVTNSKPCKRCEALLYEFGVTKVYYTVHSPISDPLIESMELIGSSIPS